MVSYLRNLDQQASESRLYPFVLLIFSLLVFVYWCMAPPDYPALVPDSTSYLNFQAFRGAGYPLFLDAIQLFDQELIGVHYYQLGLLISSLFFLGYSIRCFSDSAIAGMAILFGVGLYPQYIRYCFTILSEPLFCASLNVFIAIHLRKSFDSRLYWVMTGSLLAWLILIKGAAWALLCAPAAILINQVFKRKPRCTKPIFKSIVFFLSSFIIVTSAGMIYRYIYHGTTEAESFMGNQLIGKFSLMSVDPQQTSYPESVEHWQQELANITEIKNTYFSDDWDYQFLFSLNYYDYLRFVKADKMLELSGSNLSRTEFQSRLATELLSLITKEYIKDVAINFYALWTQGELQTNAFARRYNNKLKVAAKTMHHSLAPYYLKESGRNAAYLIKPFLYFSFLLNIACVLYGFRYWGGYKAIPSHSAPLFVIAGAIQSYYLLVALLQAGLSRYIAPMWPLLLLNALLSILLLSKREHRHLKS